MNLDQLETFIAIAEHGGLRLAAEKLNKTQPSLSIAIKNLEEELGVKLLNRSTYRVTLTEQGKTLLSQAETIKKQFDQFRLTAENFQQGVEPVIRLAIDYLCPISFLLRLLQDFFENNPQTKLEMDFEVLQGAEERVLVDQYNLAITPFFENFEKLESEKICNIQLVPVMQTKIFRQNKPENLFIRTPQIFVKNTSKSSEVQQGLSEVNKQSWLVNDHLIKKELILNGFGWGFLELQSINEELKNGILKEIKTKAVFRKKRELFMIRAINTTKGPVATKLWEKVRHEFKSI